MSTTKVNLSIAFDLQLELTEEAVNELVGYLREAKNSPDDYPTGFVNAASKIVDINDLDDVMRVITGEVTGDILLKELHMFYPDESAGFTVKVKNVVYLETPPRLDPPADAVPVVIQLGDKLKH